VTAVWLHLRGVKGLLILDVTRVLFAPLLPQALIALGNGEPALLLAVAGTVVVSSVRRHGSGARNSASS
jgi:hypothetical protein